MITFTFIVGFRKKKQNLFFENFWWLQPYHESN